MAFQWAFDANQVEEAFPLVPIGDYRCRIKSVEEKQSNNGNDMYVITLNISGQTGTVTHWLTLLPDNPGMTNTNLARLWGSFGIPAGTMDSRQWVGKVGACRIKHKPDDSGDLRARVSYFIERKKQDKLPAWVEKSSGGAPAATPAWAADAENAPPFDAGDLPL